MIVLALDTALGACSVAVTDGAGLNLALSEPMTRGHQERLAPMAAELMAEAGLGFDTLDRIAVCIGPGSFTGVRVGVAFAKGLAMALDIPCIGVGALEALAAEMGEGPVVAVIDGRREQIYLQPFNGGEALADPSAITLSEAATQLKTLFPGEPPRLIANASALAEALGVPEIELRDAPDPLTIARLALRKSADNARTSPLYLRAPDARTLAERGL